MIRAADIIVDALQARGVAHKDMAGMMGVRPNTLSRKISENRLTATEFVRIADSLGFNVTLTDRGGGTDLKVRSRGSGRRVKRMLDGIVYDTNMADAICRTPEENGWYIELFRDDHGRHFAVHYSAWEGVDPFITVCPDKEAEKLAQMFNDHADSGPWNPSAIDAAPKPSLLVETPLGTLSATRAVDGAHPGIYIDLHRPDTDCDMPLALVEFSADDADFMDGIENIITRVWGDARQEDYTDRVVHQNIEEYFKPEEV